jgi:hypothetical protein
MALSEEVLSIPHSICSQQTYTLSKRIAAIALISREGRRGKLGDIRQLPSGARLDYYGGGYNERTVKVHYEGGFYFVFWQDLEVAEIGSPVE